MAIRIPVISTMSRPAQWAAGLTFLVIVLGGGYLVRTASPVSVRVATLEKDVEVRVFGIGTLEAQVLSKVGFQVGGKLVSVNADQGDFVKAGALMAKLDDEAQRARLNKSEAIQRQAAANLAKVRAQRDRAEVVYRQKKNVNERRQTLASRGAVSQEGAEDAQAAEQIARSDLAVVEADAAIAVVLQDDAAAQRQLDGTVLDQHNLKAPFDARVIARHKELGGVANTGEAVFTLIAPQSVWVRAHVDEALAGGLAVGQTAFVRLRSESNRLVETELVRIDQENDRVTEERRIYVRCRKCDPNHQLRFLGEQAEVEVVKRVIPSGYFVSLISIEGYDGRSGVLWVVQDGRLAKRRFELGDRLMDGRVHVTSALPSGISIVVDVPAGAREGRAARAVVRGGS